MRVLITGITGMAGSFLAEYLLGHSKYEIHGTVRWRSNQEYIRNIVSKVHLHECDLKDPHAVTRLLKSIRPDRIFHLASQSNVAASWNSPQETLINNITAQLNLFESMRHMGLNDTEVLVAGSSEAYGRINEDELPVRETQPFRPANPYGVSKVTQDVLAYQYYQSYGLKIIRVRAFNQTGPRRAEVFATSSFAKQIAQIEARLKEPVIYVGNLEAKRDFTDIRDAVRAYAMALEKGEPGQVYNIGSGKDYSIKRVLEMLLSMSRILIEVKSDPRRMRPSDIQVVYCDNSKFVAQTGWHPEIPFNQTLLDLLNYWRKKICPEPEIRENDQDKEELVKWKPSK